MIAGSSRAVVPPSRHLPRTATAVRALPRRCDVPGPAGPYRDAMTLSDAVGARARARAVAAATKPLHMDVAIAAVVVTVTLVTTTAGPQAGKLDPIALIAGALAGGVLVARRRFPFLTLVV